MEDKPKPREGTSEWPAPELVLKSQLLTYVWGAVPYTNLPRVILRLKEECHWGAFELTFSQTQASASSLTLNYLLGGDVCT